VRRKKRPGYGEVFTNREWYRERLYQTRQWPGLSIGLERGFSCFKILLVAGCKFIPMRLFSGINNLPVKSVALENLSERPKVAGIHALPIASGFLF